MTTQNRSIQNVLEEINGNLSGLPGSIADCDSTLVAQSVDNLRTTLEETNTHLAALVALATAVADVYAPLAEVPEPADNNGEA